MYKRQFKQFDIIYLLTQQRGYMTGATLNTVITYAHQNAFASNNYGPVSYTHLNRPIRLRCYGYEGVSAWR